MRRLCPPGDTLDDLLDEAGISASDIPFIDDSLAGDAFSGETDNGDYERNIMIILAAIASALFAAAVLGLGSRFNPLRAGLLGGGLIVFLTAMVYWATPVTTGWASWCPWLRLSSWRPPFRSLRMACR